MNYNENDDELNQKRDLLKTHIIDQSYDQNKFIHFCCEKKEHGDELSNWTFSELNEVINEFVNREKGGESVENDPEKNMMEELNKEKGISDGVEQIEDVKGKVEDKQTKSIQINCRKLEETVLNKSKIIVTIKNPKVIETSKITSNYINYEVETSEVNFLVKRRYSDFEWLRATLKKFNPGFMIPPLPNKKLGARRFETDFIEKRMKFLQKFIDAVMQHEILKANECLLFFLQIADKGEFESKIKEFNSIQPSPYIEDIKTFTEKVTIASEEENDESYFSNITNYFIVQRNFLDCLNYNIKNYLQNMANARGNLQSIRKNFENLYLLNTRASMKDEITKTFEELASFFKNWEGTVFKQNELIKIHIKDFFRFINMEGTAYDELIKHRQEVITKYNSESTKLNAKKEKLWKLMDITKWEIVDEFNKVDRILLCKDKAYAFPIMCTKESQSVERIRKQLGYANHNNINELKKIIATNSQRFLENLKKFVEDFYPTLTDAISVWSSLASFTNSY